MRRVLLAIAVLLAASPAAAQVPEPGLRPATNPFSLFSDSVRSARVEFAMLQGKDTVPGAAELVVDGDVFLFRVDYRAANRNGRAGNDTASVWMLATADSTFRWSQVQRTGRGTVAASFRPYLVAAFDELDADRRRHVLSNLRNFLGEADLELQPDLASPTLGPRIGQDTVAGQPCDEYQIGGDRYCVLPGATRILLRWRNEDRDLTYSATRVSINQPVDPDLFEPPPKSIFHSTRGIEGAELFLDIYQQKHPKEDPTKVPPAELARFAFEYLSSPEADEDLRDLVLDESADEE